MKLKILRILKAEILILTLEEYVKSERHFGMTWNGHEFGFDCVGGVNKCAIKVILIQIALSLNDLLFSTWLVSLNGCIFAPQPTKPRLSHLIEAARRSLVIVICCSSPVQYYEWQSS